METANLCDRFDVGFYRSNNAKYSVHVYLACIYIDIF